LGAIVGCAILHTLNTPSHAADAGAAAKVDDVAALKTEVARLLAAKLTVDGQARLATPEETSVYREALAEATRRAEQSAAAARLQLAVLSTTELDQLKRDARKRSKE
jgi:hypothetical protein